MTASIILHEMTMCTCTVSGTEQGLPYYISADTLCTGYSMTKRIHNILPEGWRIGEDEEANVLFERAAFHASKWNDDNHDNHVQKKQKQKSPSPSPSLFPSPPPPLRLPPYTGDL